MKILAINGSYRKKNTIDILIDKVIEGTKYALPKIEIEKIYLIDKDIKYCKGCITCFNIDPSKQIGDCVINDDMRKLCKKLDEADGYIFGTPIFMGTLTAVMKTFCERFCFIMSKPGRWPLKGCPTPRTTHKKAAILILSTAIIPTIFRKYCDDATSFFKSNLPCMLGSKILGSLYAAKVGIGKTHPDKYFKKAQKLGKKLGKKLIKLNR